VRNRIVARTNRWRNVAQFGATIGAYAALALFIAGLLLRLTLRDTVDALAVIFYATPWPVLGALVVVFGIHSLSRKRRSVASACLPLGVVCVVAWVRNSQFHGPPVTGERDLRVLFWNAEHPKSLLPNVIEQVRSVDADIIGVAETEATSPADQQRWKHAFPGFTLHNLAGGLLFLSRNKAVHIETGMLGLGGHHHVFKIGAPPNQVTVILIDISPMPRRPRRAAFERLNQVRARYAEDHIIVMGDFNTPRDSVHFEPLKRRFQHAFETAGSGFAETWPVPIPVLHLDHVLVGAGFDVNHCRHGWSWLSDHRPVIVDLSRRPLPEAPQRTVPK
jgi:vancomycin resistance protein VanJ